MVEVGQLPSDGAEAGASGGERGAGDAVQVDRGGARDDHERLDGKVIFSRLVPAGQTGCPEVFAGQRGGRPDQRPERAARRARGAIDAGPFLRLIPLLTWRRGTYW